MLNEPGEIDISATVFSIAVDPSSPNIVYTATDYGVYKSLDGGECWTRITIENQNVDYGWIDFWGHAGKKSLAIDQNDHNILYFGTSGILLKTENAASAEEDPNTIDNGDFEQPFDTSPDWKLELHAYAGAEAALSRDTINSYNGQYSARIDITTAQEYQYYVQFKHVNTSVIKDCGYIVRFAARGSAQRNIYVWVGKDTSPWSDYGLNQNVTINTQWQKSELFFGAMDTDPGDARLSFMMGDEAGSVWIDDVEMHRMQNSGITWQQTYTNEILPGIWEGRGLETTCVGDIAVDYLNPDDNPDGTVIIPVFSWDPFDSRYIFVDLVNENEGCWIVAMDECELTVTNGNHFRNSNLSIRPSFVNKIGPGNTSCFEREKN